MQKTLLSFLACFLFALVLSPICIKILKKIKSGQNINSYVDNHKGKQGTLSMGGIIFIVASFFSVFFILGEHNSFAFLSLLLFLFYGILGFLDDLIKLKLKQNEGLKPYQKFIGQVGIATIFGIFVYNSFLVENAIIIPFFNISINIGVFVIPFIIFYFSAVTNSVNLTDGLDGLAGGVSFVIIFVMSIIIFIISGTIEGGGGDLIRVEELKSLAIVSSGVSGTILAFLVLNSHPASIFMGDTGSLALGGFIAAITTLTSQYLLILIMGFMLVATTVSVIIQVGYYKLTKKRILRMAPLHHHLERIGWNETKIVAIYIIITIILCIGCVCLII